MLRRRFRINALTFVGLAKLILIELRVGVFGRWVDRALVIGRGNRGSVASRSASVEVG